jgi:hypothetical protein
MSIPTCAKFDSSRTFRNVTIAYVGECLYTDQVPSVASCRHATKWTSNAHIMQLVLGTARCRSSDPVPSSCQHHVTNTCPCFYLLVGYSLIQNCIHPHSEFYVQWKRNARNADGKDLRCYLGIFLEALRNTSDPSDREVSSMDLRPLACWYSGFDSRRGNGCLSLVSDAWYQVEVSVPGWSLVQRSLRRADHSSGAVLPSVCAIKCDLETSSIRMP